MKEKNGFVPVEMTLDGGKTATFETLRAEIDGEGSKCFQGYVKERRMTETVALKGVKSCAVKKTEGGISAVSAQKIFEALIAEPAERARLVKKIRKLESQWEKEYEEKSRHVMEVLSDLARMENMRTLVYVKKGKKTKSCNVSRP